MKEDIKQEIIKRLDSLFVEYKTLDVEGEGQEASLISFNTRACSAIQAICSSDSPYWKKMDGIVKYGGYEGYMTPQFYGVLLGLRDDINSGYIKNLIELIHGELFLDFLEMARHLLDEGYKDAAAVIAGSSLESQLRQLCSKNGIQTLDNNSKPIKADRLNSDLTKASIYNKTDQKSVTAWLDIRNKAAHGRYGEYQKEQVSIMIDGIRDFINRNPA